MQNGDLVAPSPVRPSPAPEIIFANWRELLNELKLGRAVRQSYSQVIEGYLDY